MFTFLNLMLNFEYFKRCRVNIIENSNLSTIMSRDSNFNERLCKNILQLHEVLKIPNLYSNYFD